LKLVFIKRGVEPIISRLKRMPAKQKKNNKTMGHPVQNTPRRGVDNAMRLQKKAPETELGEEPG